MMTDFAGLIGQADGTCDVYQQGRGGCRAMQLPQHSMHDGRTSPVQPQAVVCEAATAPAPAVTDVLRPQISVQRSL